MSNTKKYLGVDWGQSRIGLALGDGEARLATPFKTVANLEELLSVVLEEGIEEIVAGLPIKMSGAKDNLDSHFLEFKKKLIAQAGINIKFVDERLSSKAGDRLVGNKKTKASRDEIAAMLILQDYLDAI